ncbi:MAG: outer membrane beta-barrel protein [Gemmatimonadota bacterium]
MSGARPIWLSLCLVLALAPATAAQHTPSYTLGASVGLYLPTADLVSDQNIVQPGSGLAATISFGQRTSGALVLRGTRTLSAKLAIELEFFWANSQIELSALRPGVNPTQAKQDARVIALSADVLYEIFRAPFTPFAIHVLGGLGLLNRGGDFFEDSEGFLGTIDGGTDPTFVLGAGFRYGLSPQWGLRLDFRDYISSYRQSLEDQDLDSELQNDFLISAGIEYTL